MLSYKPTANQYCVGMGQSANESLFVFYEEKHCRRLASFLKAKG